MSEHSATGMSLNFRVPKAGGGSGRGSTLYWVAPSSITAKTGFLGILYFPSMLPICWYCLGQDSFAATAGCGPPRCFGGVPCFPFRVPV